MYLVKGDVVAAGPRAGLDGAVEIATIAAEEDPDTAARNNLLHATGVRIYTVFTPYMCTLHVHQHSVVTSATARMFALISSSSLTCCCAKKESVTS